MYLQLHTCAVDCMTKTMTNIRTVVTTLQCYRQSTTVNSTRLVYLLFREHVSELFHADLQRYNGPLTCSLNLSLHCCLLSNIDLLHLLPALFFLLGNNCCGFTVLIGSAFHKPKEITKWQYIRSNILCTQTNSGSVLAVWEKSSNLHSLG